jgi:DNA-binding NtrC family response regulator
VDYPTSSMHCGRLSRVFVVDDEAIIARTLAMILSLEGFDADFFTRATKALASAKTCCPDLLITDVVMPDFSGIELAIEMRNQHPACEVLLFSGQAATADLLDDARCRGYDFALLQKPFHPTDLLRLIGHLAA